MIVYEDLERLNRPFVDQFLVAFRKVADKGKYILGDEVDRFEMAFAEYTGARHCVGVANGTDALTIALRCYRFRPGSEVILPSNTYVATLIAVLNAGLRPRLVEPELLTYSIDPNRVEHAVGPRTVAMIPVHLYGKCCRIEELKVIARRHNLKVIEDCAQAHGSRFNEQHAGTFGDFGAFSFYPTKNLGALGDGGCLVTNDDDLFEEAKKLRNYGWVQKLNIERIGFNSRLDELQAAFLSIKLSGLDALIEKRRANAFIYNEQLTGEVHKPIIQSGYFDSFHIYAVRVCNRDALRDHLSSAGIETSVHYAVKLHQQSAFRDLFKDEAFPIADEISSTTVSLPVSPIHTSEEVSRIVQIVNRYIDER